MAEYIEREALIKDIENDSMTVLFDKTSAIHHIKRQPTADVAEVRHGKWNDLHNEDVLYEQTYKCSVCGEWFVLETGTPKENGYNYCPHCGAKMDLGDDEG